MNMTGKFLTQWDMSEAKRHEARQNALQKREGTNHPLSSIIVWGCGCCVGPVLVRHKNIPTAEEADEILRERKRQSKLQSSGPSNYLEQVLHEVCCKLR